MSVTLLIALLAAQSQEASPRIEAAQANWNAFERVSSRLNMPTRRMVDAVEDIFERRECSIRGQHARRFDFDVNFAVRFNAANEVERVVVQDIGCPAIETMVGGAALDLVRHSFLELPEQRAGRWYSSTINFNLDS